MYLGSLLLLLLFIRGETSETSEYSGSLPCFNNGEVYASAWIARSSVVMGNQKFATANLSIVSGELSSIFMISWEGLNWFFFIFCTYCSS